MTPSPLDHIRRSRSRPISSRGITMSLIVCALLVIPALTACDAIPAVDNAGSSDRGSRMAGPVVDVNVAPETLGAEPPAPVLASPESAVRSYLDWTSYAYRIGQSQVAVPTMTARQEVRVDSYVQYNLQQSRLLDQTLLSITFGAPVVEDSRTLLPTKEEWRYRYVSATSTGETLNGPYDASYDATYTVETNAQGDWAVGAVEATSPDKVK